MEIMTYVTHGALEHRDSMGKASFIKPGDLQVMSAGTGVSHSEFNASQTDPVHFLQIWVLPEAQGLKPSYDQRHFDDMDGKLRLLASRAGRDGSLTVHQDIDLYASRLGANETANLTLRDGRGVWVQLIKGELLVNDQAMKSGDGLALAEETHVAISAAQDAEFLLFDLAL
jgi:redox-sensitive bicupin YhaK (pirin superfamily)